MRNLFTSTGAFLKYLFNLDEDRADEAMIVTAIRKDVHFRGASLWTLIFAIFIASIGLNVNSTAVIIGAMLISPLMGPIMGVGLAIGINDFELLKRGVKNLSIAALISILTSALYFSITPLHDANSELLARTNPSLWDVFIAFFGGLAGIVAGTRKEKTNVVPGVAIATALMPPLCTAGFGLATGNWFYLLGALYLFLINSLFICLATFLVVKHLRFHKKEFASRDAERRVTRYILTIVILTVLPSIYLAYGIVQRSIFEANAKAFVQKEFRFHRTQVVNEKFRMQGRETSIELLLIGQILSPAIIDSLKGKLHGYQLDSTKLVIRQGLDAKKEIDLAEIKASILEDVFKEEKPDTVLAKPSKLQAPLPDLRRELSALYPQLKSYTLTHAIVYSLDSSRQDTILLFNANTGRRMSPAEQARLSGWLKSRLAADSLQAVIR